jgi:hypothetical protein
LRRTLPARGRSLPDGARGEIAPAAAPNLAHLAEARAALAQRAPEAHHPLGPQLVATLPPADILATLPQSEPFPRPVVDRRRLSLALAWGTLVELTVAAAVLLALRVF